MSAATSRTRLDHLLVERGYAADADSAARLVMSGRVSLEGRHSAAVLTPGLAVPSDVVVRLREQGRFVSRAGQKLERGLEHFGVDVSGSVALDIGASTGGFTDCLLQRGAARVYAVDSGRGQLHSRLAADERVISMERTNARHAFELPEQVRVVVADVSFISLLAVLPPSIRHMEAGGDCVALLKPQFEARRGEVPAGGVIRDPGLVDEVIERFKRAALAVGLVVAGMVESPITGDRGNREFLLRIKREQE